ncbi:CBS domain containing membrane protein [Fulvimarina pelagi HTCC2506]|uniref:CBS domain containing membrane protein n=1 Tax=Fulvimarina pelagi HTCC2506 TaxID=314231 RepID=Q0G2G5_9HYPH|nr:HPP family protein [Fulvimarina pelagi]EAU41233.1 CBS domain containing membrane protein [Fulvimarina pelagi HTCC2506]
MVRQFLRRLVPDLGHVSVQEQLRASIGALCGIAVTGFATLLVLGPETIVPLLVAPMGASAVLLFAVPSSPLAQPWSIMGGNVSAALVGIACRMSISDPLLAASVAVCLAIALMFVLRCLHPPGGAVAVTAVFAGPSADALGFSFAAVPIGLNSVLLLSVALVFNQLTGRRYPHLRPVKQPNAHGTADPPALERAGFTLADLNAVLERSDKVIDIDRQDLMAILTTAEHEAYRRRSGNMTCADVMSRDVITISPTTTISEAWWIIQDRNFSVLPVTTEDRQLVGMLSRENFVKAVGKGLGRPALRTAKRLADGFEKGFSTWMTVDRIATPNPQKATANTPIAELVPFLARKQLHHIAIVDEADRLIGLVTQTDLIAALFRGTEATERAA